jgi:hypothetical protein
VSLKYRAHLRTSFWRLRVESEGPQFSLASGSGDSSTDLILRRPLA